MFKTPEWEDDVPKTLTSFMKKKQKNKKSSLEPKVNLPTLKVNKLRQKNSTKSMVKISPKSSNRKENKTFEIKTKSQITHLNEKSISVSKDISKKSRKRNITTKSGNNTKKRSIQSEDSHIPETQNFDEILLNAKKKKFNEIIEKDDEEHLLFTEIRPKKKKKKENNLDNINNNIVNESKKTIQNKSVNSAINVSVNSKKNRLKAILDVQSNRRHINVSNKSNTLRERMLERLKAAQFRYLNEKLYTSSGAEAQKLFKEDPSAFETYHQGYQLQVKKWPVNPLDVIVKKIQKMPKSHVVADMGCGEAALSRRIPQAVRSFDLVATAAGVEACDMARTPLLTASVDVAVYCLALMGTDLTQYLVEANRVLKPGGHLLIAEVESRFDNVETFTKEVQRLGFKLNQLDKSHSVFYFLEFTKVQEPPAKKAKLPVLTLKPCIYKRR